MKRAERDKARELRSKGLSLNEIVRELGVSKASVSIWVRDVALSKTQRSKLTSRGFSVDAIEKRRINRIENTRLRHNAVIDLAKKDIAQITKKDLFLIGIALYWGEGNKSSKGAAGLANSDPLLIQMMMRFFREICGVPEAKFRGHIHTFSHLNVNSAESYWSKVSGIPKSQFYKTYSKPSIASKGKKDSLPYGTFQIYVCDTNIFLRIKGWIERLAELSMN